MVTNFVFQADDTNADKNVSSAQIVGKCDSRKPKDSALYLVIITSFRECSRFLLALVTLVFFIMMILVTLPNSLFLEIPFKKIL